MFKTRLTTLFGMRHPIIFGGMMWHSKSDFVAACARAGAMAFMTPKSHPDPKAFEADLIRCLDLAQGAPFGVNFSISRFRSNEINDQCLTIAQRNGITRLETAGSLYLLWNRTLELILGTSSPKELHAALSHRFTQLNAHANFQVPVKHG